MRARALVVLASLAALVPGGARAQHFNGTANDGDFDPRYAVTVANPVADQATDLTLKLTQADHEDPAILVDFRLPGSYQFDVTLPSLRRGETPGGAATGDCDDVIDGLGNGTNADAHFARAEIVGASLLAAHVDGISRTSPPGQPANPTDQPIVFDGKHSFLSWDGPNLTATMCLLLTSDDPRLSNVPPPIPVESATEIVAQYRMKKVADTWQVLADLSDLAKDDTLQTLNASAIEFTNVFAGRSAGNWNPSRAPVVRNPAASGTVSFSARFETCPANDPAYGNCRSDNAPVTIAIPVDIRVPGTGSHPLAKLLEPGPYAILTGTSALTLRWEEDLSAEAPTGYLVTLARPGETDERLIHRVRSSPGPCDGSGLCAMAFTFPLFTSGGGQLPADGKYAISVTAIFTDGHRSDGRCDDGTAVGTIVGCGARLTHLPGYATTEFLVRSRPWPLRYQDTTTPDRRPDGAPTHNTLLVDPATGAAEFVVWRIGGPENAFGGSDVRFQGTSAGGLFLYTHPAGDPSQMFTIAGAYRPEGAIAILTSPTRTIVVPDHPASQYVPRVPTIQLPTNWPQPTLFLGVPV